MMPKEQKSALKFPCEFTFKVIGHANDHFESEVLKIFRQHFPKLGEGAIRLTHSKNEKYRSYTVTVQAISQAQLDATYHDLSKHPQILFVL
jgi:uncharacterized protein